MFKLYTVTGIFNGLTNRQLWNLCMYNICILSDWIWCTIDYLTTQIVSSQAFWLSFPKRNKRSQKIPSVETSTVKLWEAREIGSPQHPYRKEIYYPSQLISFRIVSYVNLRHLDREKEGETVCLRLKPALKGCTQFWKEGEPRSKGASLQALGMR